MRRSMRPKKAAGRASIGSELQPQFIASSAPVLSICLSAFLHGPNRPKFYLCLVPVLILWLNTAVMPQRYPTIFPRFGRFLWVLPAACVALPIGAEDMMIEQNAPSAYIPV